MPLVQNSKVTILFLNIRGFLSHRAELEAYIYQHNRPLVSSGSRKVSLTHLLNLLVYQATPLSQGLIDEMGVKKAAFSFLRVMT